MIIPFINFAGHAGEAILFYETVFETDNKKVIYFKDLPAHPDAPLPFGIDNYVLQAEMNIYGTTVWIGDSTEGITAGNMVSLAIPLDSKKKIKDIFAKLKEDGQVLMELSSQFYSPLFGIVKDKFGVIWHLILQ